MSPSKQSVSGAVLTENYITLNANGTEANQQNAVFILTDSARNLQNALYPLNLQFLLVHLIFE
jgi:hypothetical protein